MTNQKITVHKLNENGDEVWSYTGRTLQRTNTSVTLQARFDRSSVELAGLILHRGDIFIETFYSDRWYNTFAVFDADGNRFKGWYCNVTRPAQIENDHIYAEDLALDLVLLPSGEEFLLDEGEFEALEISPEDRGKAQQALEEVRQLVANATPPFDLIQSG